MVVNVPFTNVGQESVPSCEYVQSYVGFRKDDGNGAFLLSGQSFCTGLSINWRYPRLFAMQARAASA